MTTEACERYLESLPQVTKTFPFGPETAVYKVENKMFALLSKLEEREAFVAGGEAAQATWQSLSNTMAISLKCDADQAVDYRLMFDGVLPGYHLNKMLWNTVFLAADVTTEQLKQMIEESYRLVVQKLPKAKREAILFRLDIKAEES